MLMSTLCFSSLVLQFLTEFPKFIENNLTRNQKIILQRILNTNYKEIGTKCHIFFYNFCMQEQLKITTSTSTNMCD